jgi:eukaryotic-like serine/threonine-protein kinase
MNPCPGRDCLEQLLAERLEDAEREAVVDHVEVCPRCRQALAGLAASVSKGPGQPPLAPRRQGGPAADPLSQPEEAPAWPRAGPRGAVENGAGTTTPEGPPVAVGPDRLPSVPGYEVLAELGRGGMAVVYKAVQISLGRPVALKMILAGEFAGEQERARFRTEAEAIARLSHPNIVQVHEVGEHQGSPFFSLEFCPGGSLNRKLAGTPLPPPEAARLVETLARAMQAAHQANVIHRDLKPANVLLAADPAAPAPGPRPPLAGLVPKVTDFGLAKKLDEVGRTQTGEVLGTPSYMAPEQALGCNDLVGPWTDVWALGAILYECLTGRPPFKGAAVLDTLEQVRFHEPVPVRRLQPKVPKDLETVCLKCLRKQPQQRYASAGELADDLENWLAGRPINARPAGRLERAWSWCRRNKAVAGLVAGVFLSLLLGIAFTTFFAIRSGRHADAAERNLGRAKEGENLALIRLGEADDARRDAQDRGDVARRRFHAAQIGLTHSAWQNAQVPRMLALLDSLKPQAPDEPDLRSFEWHYLRRLAHRERLTLRGHNGWLWSIAYSPQGDLLATGGKDKTVRLWDSRTGREVRSLSFSHPVGSLSFSSDGKHLAAAADLGLGMTVWNRDTGVQRYSQAECGYWVTFSPDGRLLATRKGAGVQLLEPITGREIGSLQDGDYSPSPGGVGVSFSPDGRHLAVAVCHNTRFARYVPPAVQVWDVAARKVILFLQDHTDYYVEGLAYSPDGRLLATGGMDQTACLYEAASGRLLHRLRGHDGDVRSLAFSPDSRMLVTATYNQPGATGYTRREAILWDTQTGEKRGSLRGHTGTLTSVAFSPDGQHVATASFDGMAKVWDVAAAHDAVNLEEGPQAVAVMGEGPQALAVMTASPDGRYLAWARRSPQTVTVFDVSARRVLCRVPYHAGAITLSPEGRWLATQVPLPDRPGEWGLKLWDARTGAEGHTLRSAYFLSFSPDGKRLAVGWFGGGEWTLQLWDPETGRQLRTLRAPIGGLAPSHVLGFSPDGKGLAVGWIGGERTTKLWDPPGSVTPEDRWLLSVNLGATFSLDGKRFEQANLSPDGKRFATVDNVQVGDGRDLAYAGQVHVWDTASVRRLFVCRGHTHVINAVAFSPDGERLATASMDRTVKLWDARTGQEMLTLTGHEGSVRNVIFTGDGRFLLTADGEIPNTRAPVPGWPSQAKYTLKLWDATPVPEKGGEVRKLSGPKPEGPP